VTTRSEWSRQRWLTGAAVAALATTAALGLLRERRRAADDFALPERIEVLETTASLVDAFSPAAVAASPPGRPVRVEGLRAGLATDASGGYRRALVAPAPARVRWHLRLPADAELRSPSASRKRRADRPTRPASGSR
jgi:hypothetical protein